MEIKFYNRVTGKEGVEKVYGDKFIEWLYESNSGKSLSTLICKAPLSKFYGALQDFPLSQQKVAPFIKKFNIQMDDYLPQEGAQRNHLTRTLISSLFAAFALASVPL